MTAPDTAERSTSLPPIEIRNLEHAKHFKIYRNGDTHYPGYAFCWNRRQIRTFDAFLGAVTTGVKLKDGAVRNLYTPNHGSRIKDVTDLEEGGVYVAAAQERFKSLKYTDIEKTTPRRRAPLNNLDIPKKNARYAQVSGKVRKIQKKAVIIYVWPNKESIHKPRTVTFQPELLQNMDQVYSLLDKCMCPYLGGCVGKLYSRQGYHINEPSAIKPGEFYVACKHNERFFSAPYKERELPNFSAPAYFVRGNELPSLNSSRGSKQGKEWSPDHSNSHSYPSSENSYNHRQRKYNNRQSREPKSEEEEVFPRKPVTHKRSSEKKAQREVNYDKDDGGVFKSKQNNRHTHGAREVRETRQTHTDLPVDQRRAEEVNEETTDESRVVTEEETASPDAEVTSPPIDNHSDERSNETSDHHKDERSNETSNHHKDDMLTKDEHIDHKAKTRRAPTNKAKQEYSEVNGYEEDHESTKANHNTYRRDHSPVNDRRDSPLSRDRYQSVDRSAEEEEAALMIQSHVRGYQARQDMEREDVEEEVDDRNDDNLQKQQEEAATKIQSVYRGYSSRNKQYEAKGKRAISKAESEAEREVERAESVARSEISRVKSAARSEVGRVESAARSDAGRVESAARSEVGRVGSAARSDAGRVESAARNEVGRAESAARSDAGRVESAARREADRAVSAAQSDVERAASAGDKIVDADLRDSAATTIQAGYRGFKDRKMLKSMVNY